MFFLLAKVNRRRNYSSLRSGCPHSTQRKLQNSPCSIYEYSFISFNREVIGIRRKTTENYLLICLQYWITHIQIQQPLVWNLSNFSQHGSKSENQGDFKPSIEDITLTYKLITLKQLDNMCEKRKSFNVTKSLTKIRQLISVWILSPELPAKVTMTELNKSFR